MNGDAIIRRRGGGQRLQGLAKVLLHNRRGGGGDAVFMPAMPAIQRLGARLIFQRRAALGAGKPAGAALPAADAADSGGMGIAQYSLS